MSGGSYDYLCHVDSDDIMQRQKSLQDMADRLAGLGYAKDAARETQECLLTIRQFESRIEAMINRLQPVWRAVEWWDSGDSGESDVMNALKKYRS